MEDKKSFRIIRLQAENIKMLKAVDITPTDNAIVLEGKNNQGKTSIMEAIAYALGGKSLMPANPIRNGEKDGFVKVDLGEFTVTRKWTSQEKSTLKIEFKNGMKPGSPQKFLSDMMGNLSFDPMAFVTMDKNKRLEIIKEITHLDFSEMEAEYKKNYEDRTIANRFIKEFDSQLKPYLDLPIMKKGVNYESLHNEVIELQSVHILSENISDLEEKLKSLKAQMKEIDPNGAKRKKDIDKLIVQRDAAKENADLEFKLKAKLEIEKKLKGEAKKVLKYEKNMADLKAKKEEMMQATNMPVKGLAIGSEDVLFNGVEFEQASKAQQIEVSMAMAIAENPKIRIVRILDGALLDEDYFNAVKDIAKKNDFQVWIEMVANKPSGNAGSVYIEAGEVKGNIKTYEEQDLPL